MLPLHTAFVCPFSGAFIRVNGDVTAPIAEMSVLPNEVWHADNCCSVVLLDDVVRVLLESNCGAFREEDAN